MVDKITRSVMFAFDSCREASECVSFAESSVRACCMRKTLPISGGAYFRFEDEFDPDEVFTGCMGVPVYAIRNGRLRAFPCSKDAAEALMLMPMTVNGYAKRNETRDGIHYGYLRRNIKCLKSGQ